MVLRPEWKRGTVEMTVARERNDDICRRYQRTLQVTESLVARLGLEKELNGHAGCVNCLEWNTDGSILASASDDLHVILWDPHCYKTLHKLHTAHNGNIFSVKFLTPNLLATCAADATVRIHDLTQSPMEADTVTECRCHVSRVKRLATVPDCAHLVWSAGEDGFVLQHDLRMPHTCGSSSPNVLINLINHLGRFAEAKCLAINPRRPEQLAVGANDFYVRLYDRRMIKLSNIPSTPSDSPRRDSRSTPLRRTSRAGQGDPDNNIPRSCVQYFAPGHLSTDVQDSPLQKKATTYLTFSGDGSELLVNLGSEQVYLFDINSHRLPTLLGSFIIQHNHHNKKVTGTSSGTNGFTCNSAPESMDVSQDSGANGITNPDVKLSKEYVLPERVRILKEKGNEEVHNKNFTSAIHLFNEAIALCPDCAILYSNRAAALMARKWVGDIYAAIRDCYTAISYDAMHVKSHFRLAKALMELNKAREAHECLVYFKDKFPKQSNSHAVQLLQKDIDVAKMKLSEQSTGDDEYDFETSTYASISPLERQLRSSCIDYRYRFLGHCNTTTDIKEANFLGQEGKFIVAGSDDGSFFIWSRDTGNIVRCMKGDDSIVNCIQVHPTMCLVATSGIESTVRLWSPRPEDGSVDPREVTDISVVAQANQQRMRADPFEAMLLNISWGGRRWGRGPEGPDGRSGSQSPPVPEVATCRTS